jgi:hypothetical protein
MSQIQLKLSRFDEAIMNMNESLEILDAIEPENELEDKDKSQDANLNPIKTQSDKIVKLVEYLLIRSSIHYIKGDAYQESMEDA